MKKKDIGKTVVSMVLICAVLLGAYAILHSREGNRKNDSAKTDTEAQLLLQKDYERNYPATVREVLNQYLRISQCLYNEAVTDAEFDGLVRMMRLLYDEELLAENPELSYKETLKKEITSAKDNKHLMQFYAVDKLSSAVYWTADEENFASLVVCITMNKDGKLEKSFEEFLLREDESRRWKIVGWRLTDAVEISN